jgi:isocitrate dehydrogenase kinase/phosphatase
VSSETEALAAWAVEAIDRAFAKYREQFREVTRRARTRFETRDWYGAQQDGFERLETRPKALDRVVGEISTRLGPAMNDRAVWAAMRALYSQRAAKDSNRELAETFFNSVTRRVFTTVGVDPAIEFVASDFALPADDATNPVLKRTAWPSDTAGLVKQLLGDAGFTAKFADLDGDAALAAAQLDESGRGDAVEMIRAVFFRGKGAYLVGRVRKGEAASPLIFALLHGEAGVHVDAVLLTTEAAAVVFSFTRSYFHVDVDCPAQVVAVLRALVPQRRPSDLYISLGHNKHGKTLLYREIRAHLDHSRDDLVPARGDRGLVMVVFTLPQLDVIFKVIRDRFPPPKSTTRDEVIEKYHHVFRHDRAGRLIDAQEFEHLTFDAARFAPALLDELTRECAETVRQVDGHVHIKHLYVERRLAPLNLFLRETSEENARAAVLDYGQSIRDLAATNTFPGDLLLKNFGLTRTGRVIFFDYDELCRVTDCVFRDLPSASSDDEELSAEPWFFVGPHDIFPEEFLPFLAFTPAQREVFVSAHAEVLTAGFWRAMQARHQAGEIVDIFPYRQDQRLRHG